MVMTGGWFMALLYPHYIELAVSHSSGHWRRGGRVSEAIGLLLRGSHGLLRRDGSERWDVQLRQQGSEDSPWSFGFDITKLRKLQNCPNSLSDRTCSDSLGLGLFEDSRLLDFGALLTHVPRVRAPVILLCPEPLDDPRDSHSRVDFKRATEIDKCCFGLTLW